MRSDCRQKHFDFLCVCARTTIKTRFIKVRFKLLKFALPGLTRLMLKDQAFLCVVILGILYVSVHFTGRNQIYIVLKLFFLWHTDATSGPVESVVDRSISTKSEHTSEPALPPCSASEYLSSMASIVKSKKSKPSKSPQQKKESEPSKRRKRSRSSSRKHKRRSRSRSRLKKRRSRSR